VNRILALLCALAYVGIVSASQAPTIAALGPGDPNPYYRPEPAPRNDPDPDGDMASGCWSRDR
jgi:hypothetical protein